MKTQRILHTLTSYVAPHVWSTKLFAILVLFIFLVAPSHGSAKPKRSAPKKEDIAVVKERTSEDGRIDQEFDFTGISLEASVRTPQLLYFLSRASEELQRASLERRSFMREMVKSIAEEGL